MESVVDAMEDPSTCKVEEREGNGEDLVELRTRDLAEANMKGQDTGARGQ